MADPFTILDNLHIAEPCSASWDAMRGDDRVRHCEQCDQRLYDLSTLTREQAVELVGRPGRVCVRLYRRPDGRVIIRDCLSGRLLQARRKARRAFVLAASWLGLSWLAGCSERVALPPDAATVPRPRLDRPLLGKI